MSFATDLGFDVIVSQFNFPLSLTNRRLMQLSIMQLASFKPRHMLSTRKKTEFTSLCVQLLCTLTTWHCPHSPAARRDDRYLLPAGLQ